MSRKRHLKAVKENESYEWLRPHEIVEQYGIGKTRLYQLLALGEIPSAKVGRTRHVRRVDIEKFMDFQIKA